MTENYFKLKDIVAYTISSTLSDYIWEIVSRWDWFNKSSLGTQFIRSIDSVSANIAEGFGRYGKKDKIKFYRYSYGSIKESLDWNEKAKVRKLITDEQYNYIFQKLQDLPKLTNQLIQFTNQKLQQ